MSLAEVLEETHGRPIGETLPAVVFALARQEIAVPLARAPGPATLPLLVADDASGVTWAYVYSSEEAAFQAGHRDDAIMTLSFQQLLSIVGSAGFGGIFIDSHEPSRSYPIPAQFFDEIAAGLRRALLH